MQLHDLHAPRGANRKRKRKARGESSGLGKTAGRGGKGQTARSGKGKPGLGFEGGQMPMYRRMPKRGFHNIFRKRWAEVNLDRLERFAAGTEIDLGLLKAQGLANRRAEGLRVLGRGEVSHALTVKADHFTASARQKIEAAGGKAIGGATSAPSGADAPSA
jgi:large subunit ribosomal protein L15